MVPENYGGHVDESYDLVHVGTSDNKPYKKSSNNWLGDLNSVKSNAKVLSVHKNRLPQESLETLTNEELEEIYDNLIGSVAHCY